MSEISFLEVETAPKPSAAVIWLHGLGADGSDFEPIVFQVQSDDAYQSSFIVHH